MGLGPATVVRLEGALAHVHLRNCSDQVVREWLAGRAGESAAIGDPRSRHGHAKTADKASSTVRERSPQGQTRPSALRGCPRLAAPIPAMCPTRRGFSHFLCWTVTIFDVSVAALLRELLASGRRPDWRNPQVVDKHVDRPECLSVNGQQSTSLRGVTSGGCRSELRSDLAEHPLGP